VSFSISPSPDRLRQAAAVRREALQLAALILTAVVAFFVTKGVAGSNRDISVHDAAEWFRRGQQALEDNRIDDAVAAFRRAAGRDRTRRPYVLALARALALQDDEAAARAALITLRETAPEDPEINLELARLAAARRDITEALRFYHNALYAPWAPEDAERRREVRSELVEFLLTHDQRDRAVSELLAMVTDVPDDVPHHLRAAEQFARAGDDADARRQFEAALRLDSTDPTALIGAGQAAFGLGDYALARRYLRRAPQQGAGVRSTLEIADLVLTRDPLANRISASERRRRLASDVAYTGERLNACVAGDRGSDTDAALQKDAREFGDRLKAPTLEQETIEAGLDLIERIERHVVDTCGPASTTDRALLLIAREHGGTTP
jgi:tetratricopeptide (TPR) repeat protein